LAERYLELLVATHDEARPLDGMHIVADCANGAASSFAGELLQRLGARVTTIFSEPNGHNINANCGATSPGDLVERVLGEHADGGIALDGDADRAVLVDESGRVLDGDDILLGWSRHLAATKRLPGDTVVATVMSNFGLERTLRSEGLRMIRSSVGDRWVWQAMLEHGAVLGGEQSGHVICSHHSVSGDGLLTGSHLLAIAARRGVPVSKLSDLVRLPQILVNIPVGRKEPFDALPKVRRELARTEQRISGRGRVLLRYSGTEPVARIMVEGEDAVEIQTMADRIAEAIRSELR
jgi:phosphoglucosamine mutase